MFLAPPAYLVTLQNNIRQRPIPWDGAVRSGIITDEQLTRIRAVDRAKKPDTKRSIVEDDIDAYTSLFAGDAGRPSVLESAAKQPPMLQYILVLLGDLIGCRYSYTRWVQLSGGGHARRHEGCCWALRAMRPFCISS